MFNSNISFSFSKLGFLSNFEFRISNFEFINQISDFYLRTCKLLLVVDGGVLLHKLLDAWPNCASTPSMQNTNTVIAPTH